MNQTDKNLVITTLSNSMGAYNYLKGNELAFYCPFCNHHKPKLQVNTENQKWHCWNCNSGGKKLTSLLRKLDVDKKTISIIRQIYGDSLPFILYYPLWILYYDKEFSQEYFDITA